MDELYKTNVGFEIPDEHFPTEDQLLRLKNNDETVVNELIEGLIQYAVNTTTWFIKVTPTCEPYREDLISEALLTLTISINDSLGKTFSLPGLLVYIKTAINGAICNWIAESGVIHIAAGTKKFLNLQCVPLREYHKIEFKLFNEFEFDDLIEVTLNDYQKQLVGYLIQGHSQREIAALLNKSRNSIRTSIDEIRDLLKERLN